MSDILLPEGNKDDEEQALEINYQATEEDEECFFLMYHMNIQPSEAMALNADHRKWIIARFMAQKGMEKEMMERHRLMNQLGPNLKI